MFTVAQYYILHCSYNGGREWSEFGDSSVIHMMTGWCPQVLLTRYIHIHVLYIHSGETYNYMYNVYVMCLPQ